jgi:hypothetical protein
MLKLIFRNLSPTFLKNPEEEGQHKKVTFLNQESMQYYKWNKPKKGVKQGEVYLEARKWISRQNFKAIIFLAKKL